MNPVSFFRNNHIPQGEPTEARLLPHIITTATVAHQAFAQIQSNSDDPFYPQIKKRDLSELSRLNLYNLIPSVIDDPQKLRALLNEYALEFNRDDWTKVDTLLEKLLLPRIKAEHQVSVFCLRAFNDRPLPSALIKELMAWMERSPLLMTQQNLREELIRLPQFPLLWERFTHNLNRKTFWLILNSVMQLWPTITLTDPQRNVFVGRIFARQAQLQNYINYAHFYPGIPFPTPEEVGEWSLSTLHLFWLASTQRIYLELFIQDIDGLIVELNRVLARATALDSWQEIITFLKLLALCPAQLNLTPENKNTLNQVIEISFHNIPAWESYSGRLTYEFMLCLADAVDKFDPFTLQCDFTAAFKATLVYAACDPGRQLDLLEAISLLLRRQPQCIKFDETIVRELRTILNYPWKPIHQLRVNHALANAQTNSPLHLLRNSNQRVHNFI